MCTCNNSGNGQTIADFFRANQSAVSRVFSKYPKMGDKEPSVEWAVVGAAAYGQPFIQDISAAAAGGDFSNADGNAGWQSTADSIAKLFGQAVTSGTQIANTVIAGKAAGQGQPIIFQTPYGPQQYIPGQPAYGQPAYYTPPPVAPKPGLTTTQIILLVGTAVLVVGALFFLNKQKT